MKTRLIFLFIIGSIGASVPLHAQLQKGQFFLGGGVSFQNEAYKDAADQKSKNNGLNFDIEIGQLISDKFALTLGSSFSGNKSSGFNLVYSPRELQPDGTYLYSQDFATTESTYMSLSLSLGLNNYVPLQQRLLLVLRSRLLATFQSSESSQHISGQNTSVIESKQNNYAFYFNPGLLYLLSPRFAVSGNFGGLSLIVTPKSESNSNSTVSGGFSTKGLLGISLSYFIK